MRLRVLLIIALNGAGGQARVRQKPLQVAARLPAHQLVRARARHECAPRPYVPRAPPRPYVPRAPPRPSLRVIAPNHEALAAYGKGAACRGTSRPSRRVQPTRTRSPSVYRYVYMYISYILRGYTHTHTHTSQLYINIYAAARAADENEEPELDDVIYTVTLCARQMTEEVKVSAPYRRHAPSACAVLSNGMLRGRTMHSACVFL
jgi:hypothetical protein